MAIESPTSVLTTYVTDMHALITHGLSAIDRQAENLKKEHHPDAVAAVHEIRSVLHTHLTMLDARAKGLGGSTSQPVKDAVSAVTGFAAGLINAVRPEEAAKSIRDDYTFLSHVAIGYYMLHTTSCGLGDRETAAIADKGYRDAARLVMVIDRVMPAIVLQELRQDGLTVTDTTAECHALVKDAWNREAAAAGFKS